MKKFISPGGLALTAFFLLFSGEARPAGYGTPARNFSELRKNFRNPPMEFRTAPFWVWNGKVTKQDIDRNLGDFKSKGFGGVFIHPRYGLITEYLSQEWFDLVAYSCEKAEQLGLFVWIYDENSFPSGFGGGHVPAAMPESFNQGQGLECRKAGDLDAEAVKDAYCVLERSGSEFVEVIDPGSKIGTKGEFWIFSKTFYEKSKWYGGFSYVDLLVPGVAEKFIDVTMTGYEKTVGRQFGKRVMGVFTDEPNIRPPGRKAVKWTPDLFEAFRKRWGYDLKTRLPLLFEETGDWKKVRHNTQAVLLDLFIERWAKPWNAYCERKNLSWTGHYWEHGWPDLGEGPDNMAMYAYFQQPGVDMLFNTMDHDSTQFGNVRAVKELSSAANQFGRTRTLSETYGAAGWELRFEDMKRLGDWEYALGVNLMNQHLSYMTLAGDRKHDFPQSFGDYDSWWPYYSTLADYYGRLSLALASGKQKNRILVIEPTTTAWMEYSPSKPSEKLGKMGDGFQKFLYELEKHQIEYDLGCERFLADRGRVEAGSLAVGPCAYDLIVLPPGLENLDRPTVDLLRSFLEKKGKVLSFTSGVDRVDGAESDAVRSLAVNYRGSGWIESGAVEIAVDLLAPPDLRFENPARMTGKVFHQRRRFTDGELVFLVNSSLKESASGMFFAKSGSVQRMDLFGGGVEPFPVYRKGNELEVRFDLAPGGSLLLFLDKAGKPAAPDKPFTEKKLTPDGELNVRNDSPNALTLDYCDLKLGNREEKGLYFYTASDRIFKFHGFEDNPWVSSSQYKTNILDRDHFASGTGFTASFHFIVNPAAVSVPLQAVVERPWLWTVAVNGKALKPLEGKWRLDRSFGVYDLAGIIRGGDNVISLAVSPMSVHAELEPVYLQGPFGLKSASRGWEIIPRSSMEKGSWKSQGLPFYPEGVTYSRQYTVEGGGRTVVRLGAWNGSVAAVSVNGKQAGIIGWQPYELDVTGFCRRGSNRIEVTVFGTLKNMLGPHHNVRGKGIVTPWSFKYAPEAQPQGDKYDLEEYGLFEDFSVVEKKQ
jgi:hypothetical protein